VKAPPHGLVNVADGGLVVAGNDELELRDELEEVLAHETRGDFVPAGQRLELAFGPASSLLGLDGGDEARPAEPRHVGRMPLSRRRLDSHARELVAPGRRAFCV
jgi:hypothetical protein